MNSEQQKRQKKQTKQQEQQQKLSSFITKDLSAEQKSLTKSVGVEDDKELVEFEPKDDCDTEAITKEEEWITKRKTELTTTRQIETRVKRQVVLEDGKVVEDTGPIVSTNTTEDTDKQETETTEKRDLGIPEDAVTNADANAIVISEDCTDGQIVEYGDGGKLIKKMVPRPADGLVRQTDEKRVISHEEIKDYLETEDVRHLGDFSDEAYVKAVNSGVENVEEVLLSPESQQQLVPLGPRIVANTSKSFKTIDSEDTQKRCLAQSDGTLITESKTTTEHEIIVDKDLPEKDDISTGSKEKITTVEATQRFYKQRDEQHVDLISAGKVVDTEMRYAAETVQMERDGSLERPGDWDSLSDRMRKLRRPHQKTILQQHKEAALLADRKDALTKRPLDFDREEETRKGETMKWLESHFGSESTASNESREDDGEVEPTKKTFFNVTIKSNQAHAAATTNGQKIANTLERKYSKEHEPHTVAGKSKYFQGISNWAERKETSAYREELQDTAESRTRLRKGVNTFNSADKLNDGRYLVEPTDAYVSREDIINQKRQSLSSQFLAKSRRDSRENILDNLDASTAPKENFRNLSNSRTDLRYGMTAQEESKRTYYKSSELESKERRRSPVGYSSASNRRNDYIEGRAKSYDRELNHFAHDTPRYDIKTSTLKPMRRTPSPESMHIQSSTLGRPIVPQRRRAIEKKLRQQNTAVPPTKVPLDQQRIEPPPDYSPPPRSRSSSPQLDYTSRMRVKDSPMHVTDSSTYKTPQASTSTLMRKSNQRTRFAPTMPSPTYYPSQSQLRPATVTQTTQTTPSNISTSTTASASHKSSKVGQVIGNSLRKLVSKIRSASAERKLRMKSKSKSREQTPSPNTTDKKVNNGHSTTYQQYNVIDSHIGSQPLSNDSEPESLHQVPEFVSKVDSGNMYNSNSISMEREHPVGHSFKRADSADPYVKGRDTDQGISPRQRYYLGEDPYSSTLYGKENIYDRNSIAMRSKTMKETVDTVTGGYAQSQRNYREGSADYPTQHNLSSNTLGRYSKNSNRYAGSTPNLNQQDYRTTQTLPRKLHDHSQTHVQYQQRTMQRPTAGHGTLLSQTEKRQPYQYVQQQTHQQQNQPSTVQNYQNIGPAKPARTYAKVLNRSKSFNVHGMNGSNDPSPIYIEKMTKNNYSHNLHTSQAYKSNPHLLSNSKDSSLLKSPSIVNLISRSQKDLSKIGANDDERDLHIDHSNYANYGQEGGGNDVTKQLQRDDKRQIFLKGLHQQAPDLFRTLHGDEEIVTRSTASKYQLEPKYSLDSRSPIEINKDTASIIRRGSGSNDDYGTPYAYSKSSEVLSQGKRVLMYKDEQKKRPGGSTIIEVRNINSSRK